MSDFSESKTNELLDFFSYLECNFSNEFEACNSETLSETIPILDERKGQLINFLEFAEKEFNSRYKASSLTVNPQNAEELRYLNLIIQVSSFFEFVENNVATLKHVQNWDSYEEAIKYFSYLDKRFDENFYSYHIAGLFNYNKVGKFASILFNTVGKRFEDWEQDSPLRVYTEFTLEKWNSAPDVAKMRIDIVVSGAKNVFIIENKTLTEEHNQQTKHYLNTGNTYFNGRKKCHGIFLTPTGQAASDKRYIRYSYFDLISDIHAALNQVDESNPNYLLIKNIINELKENIAKPLKKYIERAKDFRRKHGA
jgi:hypothetical protein